MIQGFFSFHLARMRNRKKNQECTANTRHVLRVAHVEGMLNIETECHRSINVIEGEKEHCLQFSDVEKIEWTVRCRETNDSRLSKAHR